MRIDPRRENPEIVRIGEYSPERKVSESIVLDTRALALYVLDTTSPQRQEVPNLEELVGIMNTRISGLVKGKDYNLDTLSGTITIGPRVMQKLMTLDIGIGKNPHLESTPKLQGRILTYDQILKFFGVARGLSGDTLQRIFHLGLLKIFPPNNFPPLFPSPVGLYKNSPTLKPYYQNLEEGFFLSEEFIVKLIEASKEVFRSDPYALARLEANIQRIHILLPFKEEEGQSSGNGEQREQIEKSTYTKDEFFSRFEEIYDTSLAVSDRDMYWERLLLTYRLWFEGPEGDRVLSGKYREEASKSILLALSTRP